MPPAIQRADEIAGPDAQQMQLYDSGDAFYAALLRDLSQALAHVRLESYIFASDEVGRPIVNALMACARRGCTVQLRIDSFGSHDVFDAALERDLLAEGVELEWCRRWSWRRPWAYQRRNHRKLAVIDERCFYLGGYNIHRECSEEIVGRRHWRDTQVRVSGPLVTHAINAFDAYQSSRRWWRHTRQRPRLSNYLMPNLGLRRRFVLYRLYRRRMLEARKRLWVTTPYFVPPAPLQRALVKAAGRGVDVRVLVPKRIDIGVVQWASRAAYARLLRGGVRVYEYLPRMLHAKVLQIDDDWATVGTANMDYRSLFINDELVLVLNDRPVCAALAQQFNSDLQQSEEVYGSRWSERPWLSWVAELIGWCLRRWL